MAYEIRASYRSASGAILDAVQTVFVPVTLAELPPDQLDTLERVCQWTPAQPDYPDPTFIRSEFSSSVRDGAAWADGDRIAIELGVPAAFSGDLLWPDSGQCGMNVMVTPGSGSAIVPVSEGASIVDVRSWQELTSGFTSQWINDRLDPVPELISCEIVGGTFVEANDFDVSQPYTEGNSCHPRDPFVQSG